MMKPFRFMHAADLHLDSPFKGLSEVPDALSATIRDSTLTALDKLVQAAISHEVDFVLVAGDVYDLHDRSLRAELRFRQAAIRLREENIRLYVVHGNHDPLDGRRAELDWPDNVRFFPGEQAESEVVTGRNGEAVARVHGISYPTAAVTHSLASSFQAVEEPLYQIGLLHANVDGDPGYDNYAPCSRDELISRGMDYWALGHVHEHKIVHRDPWIVYSGNIQGRHVRETGPRGCYLIEVGEDKAASATFVPLDTVRWHEVRIDIGALDNEQQLYDAVASEMERIRTDDAAAGQARDEAPVGHMLRVVWSGRGPMYDVLARDEQRAELLEELRDAMTFASAASLNGGSVHNSWVWLLPFRLEAGPQTSLADWRGKDGFAGDLADLAMELEASDELLQLTVERVLAPLARSRRVALYILEHLHSRRRELLKEAGELALHMLQDEADRRQGGKR